MPYKDKEKQKEYQKEWARRKRKKDKKYGEYHRLWKKTPAGKFACMKSNAKRRGIVVSMTKEDFVKWFNDTEKKCHYCGCNIFSNSGSKIMSNSLTIERKNNNGDYCIKNIVLACYRCNSVKSFWFDYHQMKRLSETIKEIDNQPSIV